MNSFHSSSMERPRQFCCNMCSAPNVSSPHYFRQKWDPSHNPIRDRREHDTAHSTAACCLRGWSWLICFRSELAVPQGPTPNFIRYRCGFRRSSVQPAGRAWACQCHGSIAMSTKWHHRYHFCVPSAKILNFLITHPWSLKKTKKYCCNFRKLMLILNQP